MKYYQSIRALETFSLILIDKVYAAENIKYPDKIARPKRPKSCSKHLFIPFHI